MSTWRGVRSGLAVVLAGAALLGCQDEVTSPSMPLAAKKGGGGSCEGLPGGTLQIQVTPGGITSLVGETGTLVATNQDGVPIPACALKWSSSDPAVATVDRGGVVLALAQGTATLRAQAGGKRTSATISVVAALPAIAKVKVTPGPGVLVKIGDQVQFAAELIDGSGNIVWGASLTWSSYYDAATISASGLMTAVQGGTSYVQASASGAWGQSKVSVNPGNSDFVVICKNEWGWSVHGDCGQGSHVVGSTIQVSFRVVNRLNEDVSGASMRFWVDPSLNNGQVNPVSLSAPNQNGEFITSWTLGSNPGNNRLEGWAVKDGSDRYGVGIWATGTTP